MKKVKNILFLFAALFMIGLASAATCNLQISMINQDPYPAIPGDYVKVVFQIDGIENPECGTVEFGLKEEYPISLDPEIKNPITIESGTFKRGYSSFYLAPYQLRIDKDVLEGNNPIEVHFQSANSPQILKEFNIYVEDTRADFEIYVKNYDYNTRELTFEILNTEKVDVEALTIEIPEQSNIKVKGANKKVIGNLDSNEYTTADFEAIPSDGEVTVKIIYTDSINVRREINKTVIFNSEYFKDRNGTKKNIPWFWIILIIAVIGWIVYRRNKKKKKEAERKKRLMDSHHDHKH